MARDLCPVMLFSGKGGVGKTTLAAATAVHLANAGSRVLLLSTDPAHNLSDVLGCALGPTPRQVTERLEAMEVDAKGMFSELAGQAGEGKGKGVNSLLKLVSETPGIDEFGAIEVLLQILESAAHDVVVVDTAPTGHTLRLLMVPQLLEGWFGTLLGLRHKIARAGRLFKRLFRGAEMPRGEELEEGLTGGRERIMQLRDQLMNPDKTQIVLVTIPEPMSVLETSRTLQMLSSHEMPVATIIVNQLQPSSEDCPHCAHRRTYHQRELENLRAELTRQGRSGAVERENHGPVPVRLVESQPWEICGPEALQRLGAILWAEQSDV